MSKRVIYRHNPAENFIVGSVGEPGERSFFLQFESISGTNAISIEKPQLIALVERFEELIRELKRKKMASDSEIFAPAKMLNGELEYPIDEDFRAGVMGITWEPEEERVSLEVQEFSEMEEFSDLVQIDEDTSDYDFPQIVRAHV